MQLELLYPEDILFMSFRYEIGWRVKEDLDLAVSHQLVVNSGGDSGSMTRMKSYYDHENETQSALKYIKIASGAPMRWWSGLPLRSTQLRTVLEAQNLCSLCFKLIRLSMHYTLVLAIFSDLVLRNVIRKPPMLYMHSISPLPVEE